MKKMIVAAAVALVGSAVEAAARTPGVFSDTPDAKHAWAVNDWNRPKPAKVEPGPYVKTGVPSDAIVLFDGTQASLEKNWCDMCGRPTKWKVGTEGDFYSYPELKMGSDIWSREHFGDCQLHLEFRHDAGAKGAQAQSRGNSGVFLMGLLSGYEIQVLDSYNTCRELEGKPEFVDSYADGMAGAIYAENPPMVNPQRRAGEWQTYDIVFHEPVWEGDRMVHPGSLTVFFNGVLVQDHWELEGGVHGLRRPLAPHPGGKGSLTLQYHNDKVHYRNIWYRPIPSRWANVTNSRMSADENKVKALRRETAAGLFAKLGKPLKPTVANMMAMGEVISYAYEREYEKAWRGLSEEFNAWLDGLTDEGARAAKWDLLKLRKSLGILVRNGVLNGDNGTLVRINAISLRLKWENFK